MEIALADFRSHRRRKLKQLRGRCWVRNALSDITESVLSYSSSRYLLLEVAEISWTLYTGGSRADGAHVLEVRHRPAPALLLIIKSILVF